MKKAEFDKFADEYAALHKQNIKLSGEEPEFFAEYKVRLVSDVLADKIMPSKILDFGCGVGTSALHFRRYFPQSALIGLDVSERSLAIAGERHEDGTCLTAFDGVTIPFKDNTLDVVFTACVFHHIEATHHLALLKECHRVTRPGGWFFIFEHNPLNPLTRHAVNSCPFDEDAVLIYGNKMRQSVSLAGYQNVLLRYCVFFPRILSALRPLEPSFAKVPFGAQYFVHGQKNEGA